MKSIKLILFVFIIFSLLGCHQNENELKITCLGNEIDYLRIQDDEINFSSLMTTRLIIKHGEEVKINILRNSGVKIIEFVLNEDGSHKYGKGQLLKTEPKMFLSFQVGYNVDDALSSQLLYLILHQ